MKPMYCRCGQQLFFSSDKCLACGRMLVFDPSRMDMLSEETPGSGLPVCVNRHTAVACNWISQVDKKMGYCLSCAMSRVIPALSKPENFARWRKLEAAKRHLIFDLLTLGLPVDGTKLAFEFKEDRTTNPDVGEWFVSTGHASGVITINAAEADEVFREQMRQQMNEPWRTLLGHMRHESGHYYFHVVVDEHNVDEARTLFGDERSDYAGALAKHYAQGPRTDWREQYISAYASCHPAEDWAECWAHYLHIKAVLEVAERRGFVDDVNAGNWHERFVRLALSLNESMRALGLPDAYPFVLTSVVATKIEFIGRAIDRRVAA